MALNDILGSLTSTGSQGGVFDDISGVIQNVGSIYDQLFGKSEDLPPAQPAPAPVAVTLPSSQTQISQTTLMIGAAVVIGLFLIFARR